MTSGCTDDHILALDIDKELHQDLVPVPVQPNDDPTSNLSADFPASGKLVKKQILQKIMAALSAVAAFSILMSNVSESSNKNATQKINPHTDNNSISNFENYDTSLVSTTKSPNYTATDNTDKIDGLLGQYPNWETEKVLMQLSYHLWSQKPESINNQTMPRCDRLLYDTNISASDLEQAKKWTPPHAHSDESILDLLSNCDNFRELAQFPTQPASREEADFPLAYVLVGTKNADQTVRLFRMIYQPQNVYCLTYDNKSSEAYKSVIQKLAGCFPTNVLLSPSPENIYYAQYSIVHSVMTCLRVLVEQKKVPNWRYVQIVSWNDMPLRTNRELVQIFKIFNGSQDCELAPLMPHFFTGNWYFDTKKTRTVTPDGLKIYKGGYATTMTQDFVRFLFDDPISMRFFEWLNGSWCAEEHYWTTIIHNLQLKAPGGFPGECLWWYERNHIRKPFMSRYQVWNWDDVKTKPCNGKRVNLSCVYGVGDLSILIKQPELVAHKMYAEFEPAALYCLEEWYWNRTNLSLEERDLNMTFYEQLPAVRYHNSMDKGNFVC